MIRKRILLQHEKFKDDPVEAFKFCLEEMQNQNMLVVVDERDSDYKPSKADVIITDSYLFIVSTVVFDKMVEFYKNEFDREFPCRKEAGLRKALYHAKKLHLTRDNLNTSQHRYNGKRLSGFYIYKNLL